ncbi:YsnF/AvaK domain-containing protein [Modestobacter muralis]|uniref:YsnF/AvaK domain-containing protein n=1 Tax=Modestobacter muralis TaxID=1608614 RepID=A0A6P0EUM3_9ACTN|nr:YsnF/AvaK domain-containing protein [Modestobacter muralis]NEK93654.1 YsnF/AvaK domain-containing protein [Modestobacter muralis]NEN50421.1 YsnF/AvaK domain-containing protein [Modestobacter muralis]
MIGTDMLDRVIGANVYDNDGDKIGTTTSNTSGFAGTAGTAGTVGMAGAQDLNQHGTVGHDTSGPTTDDAMTLSEERLNVGTQRVEAGRARLRKYVVTENVTQTVPVSHEEVRVQREPITDANMGDAMSGPAISEEEHEVVLHAEQPVVAKEAVPVERVRLDVDTVTEQQQVTDTVRKEQVDTDGIVGNDTTGGNRR